MATHYIDTTLTTGLNDGSSIANAWQDLGLVLRGTQVAGTYAAGDTIIIRSHDGIANITFNLGATAFNQAAIGTDALPVIWQVDDGTVWATGGVFTLQKGGDVAPWTISGVNEFRGINRNFVIQATNTLHQRCFKAIASTKWKSVVFDNSNVSWTTSAARTSMFLGNVTASATPPEFVYEDCAWNWSSNFTNKGYPVIGLVQENISVNFIGCDINYLGIKAPQAFIAGTGSTSGNTPSSYVAGNVINVFGGNITNANATSIFMSNNLSQVRLLADSWTLSMTGMNIGYLEPSNLFVQTGVIQDGIGNNAYAQGLNDGTGMIKKNNRVTVDWLSGRNYPTASAILPDTARTPFSLRVFVNLATKNKPAEIVASEKFYNGASAIKTLSTEICIKNTVGLSGAFDNPKADEWWIEAAYVDAATGAYKFITSQANTALTASVATWIPIVAGSVVYGANNYDRYALTLTTPTAVKQDSMIFFSVKSSRPSIQATDYYFVDPNPNII